MNDYTHSFSVSAAHSPSAPRKIEESRQENAVVNNVSIAPAIREWRSVP